MISEEGSNSSKRKEMAKDVVNFKDNIVRGKSIESIHSITAPATAEGNTSDVCLPKL